MYFNSFGTIWLWIFNRSVFHLYLSRVFFPLMKIDAVVLLMALTQNLALIKTVGSYTSYSLGCVQ